MLRNGEKLELENVNHPGQVKRVDANMYEAMKRAFLKILPKTSPGLTVAEIQERVAAHLPEELFPGGAKAGWWTKAVQLDLEAKGIVAREKPSHSACARHDADSRPLALERDLMKLQRAVVDSSRLVSTLY
jgi:uncharacterized protein DUF6958